MSIENCDPRNLEDLFIFRRLVKKSTQSTVNYSNLRYLMNERLRKMTQFYYLYHFVKAVHLIHLMVQVMLLPLVLLAIILKAYFDETFVLPHAYIPSKDGTKLERFSGSDKDELTVGGELNKLAGNVGLGRNFAGVHYWSDFYESILLSEMVAIELLRQEIIYQEKHTFNFTKFNGEKITIA
jgi:hypothetical protein